MMMWAMTTNSLNSNNVNNVNDIKKAAIIGANGAIGSALVKQLLAANHRVYAFVRQLPVQSSRQSLQDDINNVHHYRMDISDESSIKNAADAVKSISFDLVIIATGMLHNDDIMPEKALKDLSLEKLQALFTINTFAPALIAKYFLPLLHRKKRAVFAALSARVSSISDNHLGGWYSYRASKAALNMLIKTASIELSRKNKSAIIVGLHPGTVDSRLSSPFQRNVPAKQLFSAEFSANQLLTVINQLEAKDSGGLFAYDGSLIPF